MTRDEHGRFARSLGRSRGLAVIIGFVSLIGCFRPQLTDIIGMAFSGSERSYVLLVPFVAIYLALVRRTRWKAERGNWGSWIGCLIVGISFIVAWFGYDRDILALWHVSSVLAFIGLFIAAFGLRRAMAFSPALFVLLAFVPIPGGMKQMLAQPLQLMATEVTAVILSMLGLDVARFGALIEINGYQVAVGEACNGMRLLLPLAVVMYAFVFSLPLLARTRTLLLVLCVPVALLCNVIRLVPTALAYGYIPGDAVVVHEIGGWMMIPLAIFILVGLLRVLEWADLSTARFRLVTA